LRDGEAERQELGPGVDLRQRVQRLLLDARGEAPLEELADGADGFGAEGVEVAEGAFAEPEDLDGGVEVGPGTLVELPGLLGAREGGGEVEPEALEALPDVVEVGGGVAGDAPEVERRAGEQVAHRGDARREEPIPCEWAEVEDPDGQTDVLGRIVGKFQHSLEG
jgi:hypothetical protein